MILLQFRSVSKFQSFLGEKIMMSVNYIVPNALNDWPVRKITCLCYCHEKHLWSSTHVYLPTSASLLESASYYLPTSACFLVPASSRACLFCRNDAEDLTEVNQGKQLDHGADHLRHLPRPLPHRLRREAGRQQGGGEEGLSVQHQLQEVNIWILFCRQRKH